MEELRALLDAQEEERELVEEHARRMFNLTARTVVSLQQQKEARIAVERAKSCLKLPKTAFLLPGGPGIEIPLADGKP